jgi:hypothetical protein
MDYLTIEFLVLRLGCSGCDGARIYSSLKLLFVPRLSKKNPSFWLGFSQSKNLRSVNLERMTNTYVKLTLVCIGCSLLVGSSVHAENVGTL